MSIIFLVITLFLKNKIMSFKKLFSEITIFSNKFSDLNFDFC